MQVPRISAKRVTDPFFILAEAPFYDPNNGLLYFVDILGCSLYVTEFEKLTTNSGGSLGACFNFGKFCSAAVPLKSGKELILALKDGIYAASFSGHEGEFKNQISNPNPNPKIPAYLRLSLLVDPELGRNRNNPSLNMRYNDGKANGKEFFVGSMDFDCEPCAGALHCVSVERGADGKPEVASSKCAIEGTTISNGLVWSSDGQKMYYVDSPLRRIDCFDVARGSQGEYLGLENRRSVFSIPADLDFAGSSVPDGMAIDSQDKLWVAFFNGSRVCRIDPENGQILLRVDLEGALNVTACAFAGQNLDQLVITTAKEKMSDEMIRAYPNSGCLFVCDLSEYFCSVGARGRPFDQLF